MESIDTVVVLLSRLANNYFLPYAEVQLDTSSSASELALECLELLCGLLSLLRSRMGFVDPPAWSPDNLPELARTIKLCNDSGGYSLTYCLQTSEDIPVSGLPKGIQILLSCSKVRSICIALRLMVPLTAIGSSCTTLCHP